MSTITLPCFGVVITLGEPNEEHPGTFRGGSIDPGELKAEQPGNESGNAAFDGVISVILAHACAGIDVLSPAYEEGLKTAVENLSSKYE